MTSNIETAQAAGSVGAIDRQSQIGPSMPTPDGPAPKLAVIITCWNYDEYVAQAIGSVLSQGRDDCELVVIDDGSTDMSWQVICETGARAYRIENRGQRGACIHGLDQTTAPFVLFLDADDELLPNALETILSYLDDDVAKLQFPLRRIDGYGKVISGPIPELSAFRGRELVGRILKTGVYTTPPTSGNVFRRDVCRLLNEAAYDRAVDGVILFAAPFMGDVVSLSETLGLYRVHERNDSGLGHQLSAQSLRRDLQRFADRMGHLRQILQRYGQTCDLVRAEQTYFYLERRFYLAIAEGEGISATDLRQLLRLLWGEYYSTRAKAAMSVFFLIASLLPKDRARRGLAYRLKAGKRTPLGLLQALM